MSGWTIYWITRLDSLQGLAIACAIAGGGAIAFLAVGWWLFADDAKMYDQFSDEKQRAASLRAKSRLCLRWLRVVPVFFVLALLAAVLTPSMKEAAAIYLIPKIVNNEQVQQVPDKAMQLLQGKLDEWISETAGKKEKK